MYNSIKETLERKKAVRIVSEQLLTYSNNYKCREDRIRTTFISNYVLITCEIRKHSIHRNAHWPLEKADTNIN